MLFRQKSVLNSQRSSMSLSLSTEIADFFSRFSERRYCENDLSDVTWAMCQAVPRFAEVLAEFVWSPTPLGTVGKIEREVDLGAANKVDISCNVDFVTIFIEVKIYDRNYHFREYAERIADRPGSRLVLLTNHVPDREQQIEAKQLGCSVLLWRDFVNYVDSAFGNGSTLVSAYLRYVRRVCNMRELSDIRFDPASLHSLVSFSDLIEEVIRVASYGDFTYSRYENSRDYGRSWTGAYFELQYQHADVQREVLGFFGLGYGEPGKTKLCVCFDSDWNPQSSDLIRELESFAPDRTWSNAGGFGIAASDEDLELLLTLPLAEQRSRLKSLFKELLRPIERGLAKA